MLRDEGCTRATSSSHVASTCSEAQSLMLVLDAEKGLDARTVHGICPERGPLPGALEGVAFTFRRQRVPC